MNEVPSLIDIYFVIALIIPGFLAWQTARFVCNEAKLEKEEGGEYKKTSFDATIYSLAFTLPIIATFSFVTGIQSIDAMRDNLFNPKNLVFLIFLAGIYGSIFGGLVRGLRYLKKLKDKKKKQNLLLLP